MALVCADHAYHTFAADDLAVAADFLDRSRNSHFILLKLCIRIHSSTWTLPVTAKSTELSNLPVVGFLSAEAERNGLHISVT